MESHIFTGIGVAVTTAMTDGQVDYQAFERHLNFLKDNNVQAFIINGTTGEATTLTDDEKHELIKIAIKVGDGQIPVIAGSGSNSTQQAIEDSIACEKLGVDGLLVITPYYNKTSQKGLIAHFNAIADAVDTPIIVYDVPSRTGMTIEADTLVELSKHKNIVGIKDATNDFGKFAKVRRALPSGFSFYSGNDDSSLSYFNLGGHGLISVLANAIPKEYQEMYEAAQSDQKKALEINDQIAPLLDHLTVDVNPIPIKYLTSHLGFGSYELRLPLVPMEQEKQDRLLEAYQYFKGD